MNDNQTKEKKTLDSEFMIQLRIVVGDFLSNDNFQEAYRFVRTFEGPLLSGELTGLQEYLDEIKKSIIQAKWVALHLLKEGEILELFRDYFLLQYELPGLEYDLWNKVRTYLITLKVFQDRDDMRKKIREVLLVSREMITSQQIASSDGKIFNGTVGNWLNNYNKEMGVAPMDALKINTYLNKHAITDKLSSEEVEKLRKLFSFFEIMKISSLEPEGYEENFTFYDEKLGPGIVRAGRFEPIDPAGAEEMKEFIKKMRELKIPPFDKEEGDKATNEGPVNQERSEEETALDKKLQNFVNTQFVTNSLSNKNNLAGGDIKTLRNHFYQSVNAGKAEEAVAALFLLAESGKLREVFGGDERFMKFWGDYLVKNNLDKAELEKDPANARDLARFLQYILESRLKMAAGDAAMVGVIISNMARKAGEAEYKTLAYGDMESGEFRWNV